MRNSFDMPIYQPLPGSRSATFGTCKTDNHRSNENRAARNWTLLLTFGSISAGLLSALGTALYIAGLD